MSNSSLLIFLTVILLCFSQQSSARNNFQDKPIITESINSRLQLQLIEDESEYIAVTIRVTNYQEPSSSRFDLLAVNKLSRELSARGFRFKIIKNSFGHTLSSLSSKESSDSFFSTLTSNLDSLLETNDKLSFDVLVSGSFNQQRLLGLFYKELNGVSDRASSLTFEYADLLETPIKFRADDWKELLVSGLLQCSTSIHQIPSYIYDGETLLCLKGESIEFENIYIHTIALRNQLALAYQSDSSNLLTAMNSSLSFVGDKRFQMYAALHNGLVDISVDKVVLDYQKAIGFTSEPETELEAIEPSNEIPSTLSGIVSYVPNDRSHWRIDLALTQSITCSSDSCTNTFAALSKYLEVSSDTDMYRFVVADEELDNWLENLNTWLSSQALSSDSPKVKQFKIYGLNLGARFDEIFTTLTQLTSAVPLDFIGNNRAHQSAVLMDFYATPNSIYFTESTMLSYIVERWLLAESSLDSNSIDSSNTLLTHSINDDVLILLNGNKLLLSVDPSFDFDSIRTGLKQYLSSFTQEQFENFQHNALHNLTYSSFERSHLAQINHVFQLDDSLSDYADALKRLRYDQFMRYYNAVIKSQLSAPK